MREYLTREDVATLLQVSERQVDRYRAKGQLAYYRLGGAIRFTRSDVDEFVRRMRIASQFEPRMYRGEFTSTFHRG